tara:strand:- start:454 stop:969 length:516 start_codon:yes stop_codon:yes gene_type:complete
MKTLILSSSLSQNSKSFVLCKEVQKQLLSKKINVTLVDARKISINKYHQKDNDDKKWLTTQIKKNDNIIIGMGVHNFSINDNLKIILDNCFSEANGKFFGIICAAGGEKSYLSTIHLTQICMNQWKMIQLPQIIYATHSDFIENKIASSALTEIIKKFCNEFYSIGKKLLN